MNQFIKYSFIVTFFGSIAYLVYAFASIDPQVKADANEIMKERRAVIEKTCKFVTNIPERYECYFNSAQSLQAKIKTEHASAFLMYVNTFELNLDASSISSEQYEVWRAKLILDIHKLYQVDDKYLIRLNHDLLKEQVKKLQLSRAY